MMMVGYNLLNKKDTHVFEYEDFKNDREGLVEAKRLEKELYYEVLDRVIANPRYYLDNLDNLEVFRVSFLFRNHHKEKVL